MGIEARCSYFGNSWIGMFIKGNDDYTLIPVDSLKKLEDKVEQFLKTEVIKTTLGQSNLMGAYSAMNSNGIILPNVAYESEVGVFRKTGLNVYVSKDKHNAHGNNISVNNKGGIINPRIGESERKRMEDVLGVELVPTTVGEYYTVGSSCLSTDSGFLAHFKTSREEIKVIEDALKVKGELGTVNTGSGFVSYGAVANTKGYLAGEHTTPFELGRLIQAMDLLDKD